MTKARAIATGDLNFVIQEKHSCEGADFVPYIHKRLYTFDNYWGSILLLLQIVETNSLSARLLLEEVGLVLLLAVESKLGSRVLLLILRDVLDGLGNTEPASILVPGPKSEESDLDETGQADPEGDPSVGSVGDGCLNRGQDCSSRDAW